MNYFELHKEYLKNYPTSTYIKAVQEWYDCIEHFVIPDFDNERLNDYDYRMAVMDTMPMNLMIFKLSDDQAEDMMNGVRSWLNAQHGAANEG